MFKLIALIFCGFIAFTKNANAVAWTKEKGRLEMITSYSFSTNQPKEFITGNYKNKISYYDKQEFKLYSEYGITNNLTGGFSIENNAIRIGKDVEFNSKIDNEEYPTDKMSEYFKSIGITEADFNSLSPNDKNTIYNQFLENEAQHKIKEKDIFMKLFVRQKLFQNKNIVLSFQPTFQFPLTKTDEISEKINYINTKKSLELMFSLGSSFEYKNINSIFNQRHFVNLNIGYKKIFDNFYDEINLGFAGGIRMNQTSFMLFEIFKTYNNQSPSKYGLNNPFKKVNREYAEDAGNIVHELNPENNYYLKTENTQIKLSSITQFSDLISVQIGIFKTYMKYNDSYGAEISLWFNI